jgi:molybdopterin biosynthesis enzyme
VKAFEPRVLGAVTRENLEPRQRQRFEASLNEKVNWYGSRLLPVRYAAPDAASVAGEVDALCAEGAEILIAAGAGSLDPLDPIFAGLRHLGGRMERHGVPAHPGSLLWLAEVRGRPVLGMPACGMFCRHHVRPGAAAHLAGLPTGAAGSPPVRRAPSRDSAYRFPPYRTSGARGELSS